MREVPPHVQRLLESRYYLRSESGELLENSLPELYQRVAHAVSRAEVKYDEKLESLGSDFWCDKFYNLMIENRFIPNTPCLSNASKENASLSACFALEIEDSMHDIFDTLRKASLIFKGGGGLGLSFSNIREKGTLVKTTGHKASGPVSFMRVFNEMCNCVAAAGGRRGGMLAGLDVSHPDILEFISCKDDGTSFTNFNISIIISDIFMEAVKNDTPWSLISPNSGEEVIWVGAKDLWNKICKHAWKTGEPGLIFIDTANRDSPFLGEKEEYIIKVYNLCGEQPLLNEESCTLGAINLSEYVYQGINGPYISYAGLEEDIPTMVRFLDNVIDVTPFILPEIEAATKKTRKIGLGIMGWADMLIKMKIPYDSEEAIKTAELVMGYIKEQTYKASSHLGFIKGNFPAWKDSIYGRDNIAMRNSVRNTCAPTGTTGRIAGSSGGIEPIYAWSIHHSLGELEYDEVHEAWKELQYALPSDEFQKTPKWMVTAKEISPEWHLRHQEVFQKHIDSSVSKTCNLPNSATEKDVEDIFMWAWEHQLKGITVYRDGSRDNQPLQEISSAPEIEITTTPPKPPTGVPEAFAYTMGENIKADINDWLYSECKEDTLQKDAAEIEAYWKKHGLTPEPKQEKEYRQRGNVSIGCTHKVDTGKGKIYITVNYDRAQQDPVEVFIRLGPSSTPREIEMADWSSRMLSLCLKHNVPISDITRQSEKIFGDGSFIYQNKFFNSLPQLISHLIKPTWQEVLEFMELEDTYYDSEEGWEEEKEINPDEFDKKYQEDKDKEYCYECSQYVTMIRESNCLVCSACGYSKCG